MEFFSPGHLIVIAIVAAVLFFGWKQLPDMARSAGRSLRVFRTELKGMTDDDAARSQAAAASSVNPPPPMTVVNPSAVVGESAATVPGSSAPVSPASVSGTANGTEGAAAPDASGQAAG